MATHTHHTDENLPEEFASDDVDNTEIVSLDDVTFDDARDEEERAKLYPPTGDWDKQETWKSHVSYNTSGRMFVLLNGKPQPRAANGLEYAPQLFFRISHEIGYKHNKPGETDTAYRLFLKAKEMYIALHDRKAKNMAELIQMLEEENYTIRTMNGDNGPIVLNIKRK